MSLCRLHRHGDSLVHRHMPAGPAPLLPAIAPSREDLVVWVACLCPWSWRADLCARAGMPGVLGPALSLPALQGGKATHDTIAAQNIAVLRRGGMLPQASVSPAAMRATRALLRRRVPLTRTRAALLAHIQPPTRQDTLPESGQQLASKAHRDGVAERCPAPAVPKRVAVARALMACYAQCRREVAWTSVPTAPPHHAPPVSRRPSVPGIGPMVRVGLLDERPALTRCPRVQDVVSSCRVVTGPKDSAGQRAGTAGTKLGQASLTWACSAAAGRCRRTHPAGQKSLAR